MAFTSKDRLEMLLRGLAKYQAALSNFYGPLVGQCVRKNEQTPA